MLSTAKRTKKNQKFIEKAIVELRKKGFQDIKADIEDFEKPARLVQQEGQIVFIPDITAMKEDGKSYFEIGTKTENEIELVGKWKLLSTLATLKNGIFTIYAPKGHKKFTTELVTRYKITANVESL